MICELGDYVSVLKVAKCNKYRLSSSNALRDRRRQVVLDENAIELVVDICRALDDEQVQSADAGSKGVQWWPTACNICRME
jgi:hypothetical protein